MSTLPNPIYRADPRGPEKILAAGGFKSWGSDQTITIIEHVKKLYNKPHRQGQDPWISTSGKASVGEGPVVDKPCWVYVINTTTIASRFTEVAPVFAAAGEKYGHANEEEWAAYREIPLACITSFYQIRKDGKHSASFTWASWEAAQKAKAAKPASGSGKGSGSGSGSGPKK
ncbi:hypothetical protein INS49_003467 [Diaporthe citri]|uniref:uncharacterized protein n=1 Tax=Diaporthe citri TaxID=83186 RepID=UPI001C80D2E7|nr:uncharacterized protein INS49_003467 [Diaporthe citri]KAG6355505.1 hypothetical protein INS49_003467 [Diaporthe citri]